MALSVQNKNFLSLLHKLDIDLNQFPDQTFDGLFDNVSDNINHFFNWFIDSISSANVLTKMEEIMYFELETNNLLPTENEVESILLTSKPTFDELQSLDVNNVKIYLPQMLNDLRKSFDDLLDIDKALDVNLNKINKIHSKEQEKMNIAKKQFEVAKDNGIKTNLLLNKKVDEIQTFLLMESNYPLSSEVFEKNLLEEEIVYQQIKSKILENQTSHSDIIQSVPNLEENLSNAKVTQILTEGLFQVKKNEFKLLEDLIQNLSEKFDIYNLSDIFIAFKSKNCENISFQERLEEIKVLEKKLFNNFKILSQIEIKKIMSFYFLSKREKNAICTSKLMTCKNLINMSRAVNSWLQHILLQLVLLLERAKLSKKDCLMKLKQHEVIFYNNFKNFELKKKKFEELCHRLSEFKFSNLQNSLNTDFNLNSKLITISAVFKLVIDCVNDACCEDPKTDFQLIVNKMMNNVFYGPTNQIINVPVDLIVNFQKCELHNKELSKEIQRLVNTYLEIKQAVSKSDRKALLLWMDFLTNPNELQSLPLPKV